MIAATESVHQSQSNSNDSSDSSRGQHPICDVHFRIWEEGFIMECSCQR